MPWILCGAWVGSSPFMAALITVLLAGSTATVWMALPSVSLI